MEYLTGNLLKLRAPEPEDLDILYQWENDTSLWESGDTFAPFSRYILHEYLKTAKEDIYRAKQLRLMISRKSDAETVGMIDFTDFDPQNRRSNVGILIFPDFRQKGYAQEALKLMINYGFRKLHLHQLYAYINESNSVSIKLFSGCGFKHTATLQDWINKYENNYENVIVMQLISENNQLR